MNNKYLYMVVGAIIISAWFYTGHAAYYSGGESDLSEDWWYAMILAVGLGAGSTGGDDVISIFVESIKGYISTLVLLGLVAFFGYSIYSLAIFQALPEVFALGKVIVSFLVSGLLTNMALSYLRKANA